MVKDLLVCCKNIGQRRRHEHLADAPLEMHEPPTRMFQRCASSDDRCMVRVLRVVGPMCMALFDVCADVAAGLVLVVLGADIEIDQALPVSIDESLRSRSFVPAVVIARIGVSSIDGLVAINLSFMMECPSKLLVFLGELTDGIYRPEKHMGGHDRVLATWRSADGDAQSMRFGDFEPPYRFRVDFLAVGLRAFTGAFPFGGALGVG